MAAREAIDDSALNMDREVPHRVGVIVGAGMGAMTMAERELTRLYLELKPNRVAPGFIPVERHEDVPDAERGAYLATVPAGHMGTPADVAHAVAYFASEAAGFVTGQRLVVDGGRGLLP